MPSLAAGFLALCARQAEIEPLDRALAAAADAGRAAWPALPTGAEAFVRHLARHAPAEGDLLAFLGALHAADLWLACACAEGNPQALAAFDQGPLAGVPSFLARANEPSDAADEVVQTLREQLLVCGSDGGLPRIASYSGRGPLSSWVRVAALRLANKLRRRRRVHSQLGDRDVPESLAAQDPELQILRSLHRDAVPSALRDAFSALPSEERALLRLHFLDGLNLERLGVVFQVSRATAGRMLVATRERLLEETLALLRARLKLGPAELESLLGALRSKLDVSLHALLREP